MTTLQQQARALGDPTRHRIFRYVADAGHRVEVAELTEHFGLNHNAIRQHLAKLVDADLLVAGTTPPKGRGRPRLHFMPSPSLDARWGGESSYERLSVLLAEVVATGDSPADVGRRSGVRTVAPLGGPAADGRTGGGVVTGPGSVSGAAPDPVDALIGEMARHGFDPAVRSAGDEVEVVLQHCPFASAVMVDPAAVCELHLGIAQGVAERTGSLVVEELLPRDPRTAGCVLRCRRVPTDEGVEVRGTEVRADGDTARRSH